MTNLRPEQKRTTSFRATLRRTTDGIKQILLKNDKDEILIDVEDEMVGAEPTVNPKKVNLRAKKRNCRILKGLGIAVGVAIAVASVYYGRAYIKDGAKTVGKLIAAAGGVIGGAIMGFASRLRLKAV